MHRLGWTDAEHHTQDFDVVYSLRQRGIEARSALLDCRKVEAGRVGDRLDVVVRCQVVVASRNCRVLTYSQGWHGLRKGISEIGVSRAAAVPCPPARVHGELHNVCEPPNLLRPCRFAAWQSTKLFQVDYICAL